MDHLLPVMVSSEDVIRAKNVSYLRCSNFLLDKLAGNACDVCNLGFPTRKSLETHMGKTHKESVDTLSQVDSQI